MWGTRLRDLTDKVPRINDYLLRDFRTEKIEHIPQVLESLFKQTISVISNHMGPDRPKLNYVSYRELQPEERVNNIRSRNGFSRNYSIRQSLSRNLEFIFEFMGEHYTMSVDVPYIENYSVLIQGVSFYPIFAIVEKGGLYRSDNSVILQVMRAKLRFWRETVEKFTTIEGRTESAFNITAKLHQASRGRQNNPPLILHHLACHGLINTIQMFGFSDVISFVKEPIPHKDYQHICVKKGIYIRVLNSGMTKDAKRMIIGLLSIYNFWKNFTFEEMFDSRYYIYATGKWNYPSVQNPHLLYDNALEYIHMNRTIIDPAAKKQHESIGIIYDDLDGLMLYMFKHIDELVVDYNQNNTNLYDKKIGAADQMLSLMIRKFNTKLFEEMINTKLGLRHETVKKLMYPQSYVQWVTNSTMFRGSPMLYNDNYLLGIGKARFRTTANAELSNDKTGNSLPISLLRADPSFMVVESISTYPTSNPVISGSINPFLQVDEDGYILKPGFHNEIEHVFDK
jgi:hypothetical protein